MQLWANNAEGTLSASVGDSDTTLVLQTGEGALFPSPSAGEFFKVTLYEVVSGQEVNHEIVTVTARVSDTLTVVRAQEGTTARAFAAGTPVQLRVTAGGMGGLLQKSGDSMSGLLQLDQSTNIVAAATTDLGTATGNDVTVTHSAGDVVITSFGAASAMQSGTRIRVRASISGGTLTLTHNATSMVIPGGADWKLADGDSFDAVKISDSQAYWKVENITLASGQALTLPPFTITDGASVDINPANGDIQIWTLGDNRTPTATNFENGQSVTLLIDDGAAYAITWTIVDKWFGGAPTLSTDELTGIVLFKAGGVVYGAALSEIAA